MTTKSRLWLIGIAGCLLVGFCGCRQRQQLGATYISKLFGGKTNIQVVAAPEIVQAWQTVGFLIMTNKSARVENLDFYRKAGEPVSVAKTLGEELSKKLLNLRSYDFDSG